MAILTEKVQTDDNEQAIDSTQPRKFSLIFADVDDKSGNINVTAADVESGDPVTLVLRRRGYDNEKKSYVDDPEINERAQKILDEQFEDDMTFDKLLDSKESMDAIFTAYTDGNEARFYPFTPYVHFDRITTPESKAINKYKGDFGVVAISDNTRYNRFNVGVTMTIAGEEKQYRIAQIRRESDDPNTADVDLSIKYESKQIQNLRTQLEENELPAPVAAKLKEKLPQLIAKSRENVVERLNNELGIDIDEMIENGEGIKFDSVEVKQVPSSDNYFLVGIPAKDE